MTKTLGSAALQLYAQEQNLTPWDLIPKLSDFYVPSSGQRDREIAFVVLGMATTGLVAYKVAK